MPGSLFNLPDTLQTQLMSFLGEIDGELQVIDMAGFVSFVVEHGENYPELYSLVSLNKRAAVEHYEATGEVPPGVKLVRTTTEEGSNVVGLEILRGPISAKS